MMEETPLSESSAIETEQSISRSSSEPSVASELSSSGRNLKRKRSLDNATAPHKRANSCVWATHHYVNLLNIAINDAVRWPPVIEEEITRLSPSQLGATTWSAEQKSTFFEALARLGRHDLVGLADAAGKSVPEVNAYLRLLQRASIKQQSKSRHARHVPVISSVDIPAAAEIEHECELALERVADNLQDRVERREADQERARFGDKWLLTQDVARELEEEVEVDEKAEHTGGFIRQAPSNRHDDLLRAARLLTPSTWLGLSERVFMNPGPPREECNWFFVSGPRGGKPAMFATAFVDFFNLATIITRKLVNCALFQANSRMRGTDIQDWKPRIASVRRRDVLTALRTLNMEKSSSKFWLGAAKRNRLRVYDLNVRADRANSISFKKSLGDPMDYDAVERKLDDGFGIPNVERAGSDEVEHGEGGRRKKIDVEMEHVQEYASSNDFMSEGDDVGEDKTNVNGRPGNNHSEEDESDFLEEQVETFDINTSRHEEQRLWSVVKGQPLRDLTTADAEESTTRHKTRGSIERRTFNISVDWKERVDFRSEWERYETPIPRQAFIRAQEGFVDMKEIHQQHQHQERSALRSLPSNGPTPGSASPEQEDASANSAQMKRSSSLKDDHSTTESNDERIKDDTIMKRPHRNQRHAPVYIFAPVDGVPPVEELDGGTEGEYKRESEEEY